jgi:hypothetical protein
MSYVLEKIDASIWSKVVLDLKEDWRTFVIRRSWHEVAIGCGIAREKSSGNYLLSAPVFIREGADNWYFYHFDRVMYCFRIDCPTRPLIEFYQGEPPPGLYEKFRSDLIQAFDSFGFYGSVLEQLPKIDFVPSFPV